MRLKIKLSILFFILIFSCFAEDKFLLKKLTFNSDIKFSKEEFLYLTKLEIGQYIFNKDIETAKNNLKLKGRFNQINVNISDLGDGKQIHFSLLGNWILKKIYIKGVVFGKHNYSSLYKMQLGDYFDIDLHKEAINRINKYLKDNGYYNSLIQDELIYHKDKSVSVYIKIKKNKKFLINSVGFDLLSKKITDIDRVELNKIFQAKVSKNLTKKIASKEIIDKYIKKFVNNLKLMGFVGSKVTIKKVIYKNNNILDLILSVNLGKKQKLIFIGNKFFAEKYIKRNFLGLDYPAWFFTPEIIAQDIFDNYYKHGYWNSVIFYKHQKDGSFLFNIEENLPVIVKSIQVKDIKDNLIKDIKDNLIEELQIFVTSLENKIFNESFLNQAIINITDYYFKNGFWDFKILDKQFVKNKKENSCNIILTIEIGKQRFFGEKPFNFYWLQEQKNLILKKLQKQGYWYAQITPKFEEIVIDGKLLININWDIDRGPQIKFGPVFVKGNSKISFKKIVKELKFKEDDIWDSRQIDATRKNFKKLDLFKTVQIESSDIVSSKDSGIVPINLTLIDKDPIEASFRLGYFLTNKNFLFKKASTYRVGTSLIFNNPTNNLDKFTLNADLTRFERKFDFEYKVLSPFGIKIDDSRLVGKVKVYANKTINPVEVQDSQSAYQAIENGFLFGINNEFKRDYFWRLGIGNEWIRTEKVRGNLNLDSRYINQTLPYFFINPSFVVEKINDHLDIKKGAINFVSFRFMIPEYEGKPIGKLTTEHSFFTPIYKDTVLALRIRLGYILNSDFNTIQPSQRFFLGGPFTVRGYEKDAIPPYGVQEYVDEHGELKKRYTIQGGSGMFNLNLELRFPVYKLLRGVIFQDLGVLSQSGFAGFKGKWYPSTGLGLRYKTPIGSIRFDLGFKWKHLLPDDNNYSWYLTLGEVF